MTELKEKRKNENLTQSEANMRNSILIKLHESGDFNRCVPAWTEHSYYDTCCTSRNFLFDAAAFVVGSFYLCFDLVLYCLRIFFLLLVAH